MRRKLQAILTDDAWALVDSATKEANIDFKAGTINYSDVVNEMILTSKIDIKTLQHKHTNLRKSLRLLSQQSAIDVDSAIKALMELKSKIPKKSSKPSSPDEVA